MPINIIDNIKISSDIPLDVRYTADTYLDVSAYWYAGMQVFQYSDRQIWWYDGLVWQNLTNMPTPSPGFDILSGGTYWGYQTDDIFNGNTTSADVLKGGTY